MVQKYHRVCGIYHVLVPGQNNPDILASNVSRHFGQNTTRHFGRGLIYPLPLSTGKLNLTLLQQNHCELVSHVSQRCEVFLHNNNVLLLQRLRKFSNILAFLVVTGLWTKLRLAIDILRETIEERLDEVILSEEKGKFSSACGVDWVVLSEDKFPSAFGVVKLEILGCRQYYILKSTNDCSQRSTVRRQSNNPKQF